MKVVKKKITVNINVSNKHFMWGNWINITWNNG